MSAKVLWGERGGYILRLEEKHCGLLPCEAREGYGDEAWKTLVGCIQVLFFSSLEKQEAATEFKQKDDLIRFSSKKIILPDEE